jgi:hypothetical protein
MLHRPVVAACLAASLQTACATMLARDREMVSVTSDLPGAEVHVNGVPYGKTPVQLPVDGSTDQTITVKVGSTVHTCVLAATIRPEWVVLDVAMGGLPVIVDAVTGRWRSLDSTFCHAAMPGGGVALGQPEPRPRGQGGSLLGDIVAEDDEDQAEPAEEPGFARPTAPARAPVSLRAVVTPASLRRSDVRLADELDIEIEGERDERAGERRPRRDDERRSRRDDERRERDDDLDELRADERAPRAAARLDRDDTPRRVESRPRRSSERSRGARRSQSRRRDAACECDRSR